MPVAAWRNLLGPPALAVVVAAAIVGPAAAAPDRSVRAVPALRGQPTAPAPLQDVPACRSGRPDVAGAWFRLDPVIDPAGALAGQRLTAGAVGLEPAVVVDMAGESFAAAPVDGEIVVGTDDGRRSIVRVIDGRRGCVVAGFETGGLVRRAVLDRGGDTVIELRLDRRTRADLGIWRRPLGGGEGERIADPLPASSRLGPIFSTELAWSQERQRIVVTSCGAAACLLRVIDPAGGSPVTVDDPEIGEAIGLSESTLIAYGGCPALPCSIVAHDLATGRTSVIAPLAGLASLAGTDGAPLVVFEELAMGRRLVAAALDGSSLAALAGAPGLRLVPGVHRAGGAIEAPAGHVALAPDGRPDRSGPETRFVRLSDRRVVVAAEVIP